MLFLILCLFVFLDFFKAEDEVNLPNCWCISGLYCCPQPCQGFELSNAACLCWINKDREKLGWTGAIGFTYFPHGPGSSGTCNWCAGNNNTSPPLYIAVDFCPDRTYCGNFGSASGCATACKKVQDTYHLFVRPYTVDFIPNDVTPGTCTCDGTADPCILYHLEGRGGEEELKELIGIPENITKKEGKKQEIKKNTELKFN